LNPSIPWDEPVRERADSGAWSHYSPMVTEQTSDPSGAGSGSLSEVMGSIARALQREHGDVQATLQTITSAAVGAVPGAQAGGISYVTGRRKVESRAWTAALASDIDHLQNRLGEGPCLDAIWDEKTVRIDDMAAERRWPRFAPDAAQLGARSSLSFQLFVEGDNLGALNLYARSPGAFGAESEKIGLVFASHAAVALSGARTEGNLRRALSSRDLIGQAKGILMERYKVTSEEAFAMLGRASSLTNRKVADIAEELCASGAMPTV
jgi:GAF domain-containing protein